VEHAGGRGRAREDILRAALRLIGASGLHAVTHRDIAAAAGVSPGSTTYHFSSLDDLLTAALELFVEDEVTRLDAAAAALAGSAPDADAVLDAMAAQLDLTLASPAEQVAQFELYLEATRSPVLQLAAARCVAAYCDVTAAGLQAAGVAEADADALAPIVVALADGLLLQQLADPRADYVEAVLKPALRQLLDAAPRR
jgi:DNA-binding transcriptional regulator YbjK